MTHDENIQYKGIFDSQKRLDRLTIYRAKVFTEEMSIPVLLELQRDMKVTNRLFIMLHEFDDPFGEDTIGSKRELFITLKQATNLLVKVKHDFEKFVTDLLYIKHNQIAIRNLSSQVFDPT